MDFELWLAFVVACTVLSVIPGPSVLMVTGLALSRGTGPAFLCILGDVVGGVFLMTLSFLGVGAILAASIVLFQVVKWAGVFYMAYLGWCQISEARRLSQKSALGAKAYSSTAGDIRAGFLVGILNPKAVVFYVAFLAQFIDPSAAQLPQFLILLASSSTVIMVVLGGYVLAAARARVLFQGLTARRRMGYAGGGFLLGASAWMATTR